MKSLHVTIDLDTLGCYSAIHGLDAHQQPRPCPIYTDALARFINICQSMNITATLFAVGRDLEVEEHAAALKAAHLAGHEIASHSHQHNYALSRMSQPDINDDLRLAEEAIEALIGKRPVGFRAPGYNQSQDLMKVIHQRGYLYDSSFLPVPLYYLARRSAIELKRRRGKKSLSLAGNPWEFLSPKHPFKPSQKRYYRPARKAKDGFKFLEIPIAAPFRLPFIGTSMALDPSPFTTLMGHIAAIDSGPVVLEFHGIDFMDPALAGADLRAEQPDLKVPLDEKIARIEKILGLLTRRREASTLESLANDFRV